MGSDQNPRVFISYSQDSVDHKRRVLALADALRLSGIRAELDQFHEAEILDWPRWMAEQIRPDHSDFVLCICTDEYKRKIENPSRPGGKGAHWEGSLLDDYLYDEKGNCRVVPILLGDEPETSIVGYLRGWTRCRLQKFSTDDQGYVQLLRILTGQARVVKAELGSIPVLPVDSSQTDAQSGAQLGYPRSVRDGRRASGWQRSAALAAFLFALAAAGWRLTRPPVRAACEWSSSTMSLQCLLLNSNDEDLPGVSFTVPFLLQDVTLNGRGATDRIGREAFTIDPHPPISVALGTIPAQDTVIARFVPAPGADRFAVCSIAGYSLRHGRSLKPMPVVLGGCDSKSTAEKDAWSTSMAGLLTMATALAAAGSLLRSALMAIKTRQGQGTARTDAIDASSNVAPPENAGEGAARPRPSPLATPSRQTTLTIDFDPNDPQCLMVWPDQERVITGTVCKYTHTVFRVRVTNTSTATTLEDVAVTLQRVVGMNARHQGVLHGHRLNAANVNAPTVTLGPLQVHYFDVVAHERENENAHPINDLFFRYAGVAKGSVPTDPGVSFALTLEARPKGLLAVPGYFRVSIDEKEFAHFEPIAPPPNTGLEPIFEPGPPYEESNYHDSSLDDGGHIYRLGLRSLDKGVAHTAKVEIESMKGAIEGGYTNRPLRFKDAGSAVEAHVPYGTGPTAFVEFLFSARFGRRKDSFLYAVQPKFGADIKTTGPFSIRLRITGASNATYVTIRFLRDPLGFPLPVGYDVE